MLTILIQPHYFWLLTLVLLLFGTCSFRLKLLLYNLAGLVLPSVDLCSCDERESNRAVRRSWGRPSAVAAGFPCCCDITTALSGTVTLATGTHCTVSVPSFIYLFSPEPSHWYALCNITSNWHIRKNEQWECCFHYSILNALLLHSMEKVKAIISATEEGKLICLFSLQLDGLTPCMAVLHFHSVL